MAKPVSLSVHKNNRVQREAKRIRQLMKDDVKALASMKNIAGYAVVTWDRNRNYLADWYAPLDGPMPGGAMPDYVRVSLLREIIKADTRHAISPIDDDGA